MCLISSARHGGSVRHDERVAFEDRERLQEFVDDEDIDRVLSRVTLEQNGQAWCRHTKRALARRIRGEEYEDADCWAVEDFSLVDGGKRRTARGPGCLPLPTPLRAISCCSVLERGRSRRL
jgi:hypothetical protein